MAEASSFAASLRAMGERGESAYGEVDGEEVIDIPAQACRGRTGGGGQTFSGRLNLRTGEVRLDCADDLPFFLEIDLSKVPGLAAQPSGPVGMSAVEHARTLADARAAAPHA